MNIELLKEKQKKIENIIKKIKTNIILNDMTKINYKGLKKIDDFNYKYDNIEFTIVDGTLRIIKDKGKRVRFHVAFRIRNFKSIYRSKHRKY